MERKVIFVLYLERKVIFVLYLERKVNLFYIWKEKWMATTNFM